MSESGHGMTLNNAGVVQEHLPRLLWHQILVYVAFLEARSNVAYCVEGETALPGRVPEAVDVAQCEWGLAGET